MGRSLAPTVRGEGVCWEMRELRWMMIEVLRAASYRHNGIGDQGAAALAGALGSMTALQSLHLGSVCVVAAVCAHAEACVPVVV